MPSKKTVLLVDEDDLSIGLHKSFLRTADLNLLTARDGNAALSLLRAAPPDLIYLGIDLEGIDGIECCRQIKADPNLSRIPVVMLAPSPTSDLISEMLQAGCNDILYKPISRHRIYATTRNFLGAHLWAEPRHQTQIDISVTLDGGESLTTRIFDYSSGGLFLESDRVLPIGTPLKLTLPRNDRDSGALACEAIVAWHNDPAAPRKPSYPVGFGVEFTRISERGQQPVDDFLIGLSRVPGQD